MEKEDEVGVRFLIWDGIASWIMATLTGNPFLVNYVLLLGASNFTVGLIAAIPPILQLLQIPSIYLIEHYRSRRFICTMFAGLSRAMLLLMAMAPFVTPKYALSIIVFGIAMQAAFAAVSVCGWNSWMRDFLPEDKMGEIYARRLSWAFLMSTFLYVIVGFALDHNRKLYPARELEGYTILFLAGFVVGMIGLVFLAKIPEPPMSGGRRNLELRRLLSEPFLDQNFRNLLVFLGSWNFAVNLAAPFFSVYLLKTLHFSMSYVIGFMVLSQIANFASFRLWGRFCDRFSNKTVFRVCGPLFVFCILLWTSVKLAGSREAAVGVLIFLHICMGIATAGITLGSQNIAMKQAPKEKATGYLATVSLVNSLASGFAPVLGGLFADYFAQRELSWTVRYSAPGGAGFQIKVLEFTGWDFFFATAFLIGIYSIHRLALVKESGEVKDKVLIDELFFMARQEVRGLSNVAGIRMMTQIPVGFVRYLRRPRGKRREP